MKKVVWTAVIAMGVGWLSPPLLAQQPPTPAQAQAAPAAQPSQDAQQVRNERRQARREHMRARADKHAQSRLQRFDRNHDGSVSRDEWSGAPKRFDRLDRNHDGVLTKDELVRQARRRGATRR